MKKGSNWSEKTCKEHTHRVVHLMKSRQENVWLPANTLLTKSSGSETGNVKSSLGVKNSKQSPIQGTQKSYWASTGRQTPSVSKGTWVVSAEVMQV
jgi:hypothetical protein